MQNSKLIRTLQVLNADELKRLGKFLNSPFFNANPAIVKLYLLLRPYHPDFDAPKLAEEKLFKKIFSSRAYDHRKMLNLMTDFTALLETYLTMLQLETEETQQKKLLLQAYANRQGCYAIFSKKLFALDKYLENLPYQDELYFQEKMELNLRFFSHPATDMVKAGRDSLRLSLQYFEAYKSLAGLKLKCARNDWNHAVGARKALEDTWENPAFSNPVYILYEKLDMLQSQPADAELLQQLADYFLDNIEVFGPNDKSNILKILLNHCNRLVNKGDLGRIRTSLDLYKTGLAYDCFLVQGRLKETTFDNIVTLGTLCGEFEWTEKFIADYQGMLPANVRADALALAQGQWYLEKQEYLQAAELLQQPFTEPQIIVKAKILLIRAWCELFWSNDYYLDLLLSQLDAFEKYMRRNKAVAPRLVDGVLNFIGFTRKIAHLKLEKKPMTDLKTKISQESNVVSKTWLLKKTG